MYDGAEFLLDIADEDGRVSFFFFSVKIVSLRKVGDFGGRQSFQKMSGRAKNYSRIRLRAIFVVF